jgi:replicative DNA helicase
MSNSDEILAFSDTQQAAILGQAIERSDIFSILEDIDVDKNWFTSEPLGELWEYVVKFREANRRYPVSWEEIVDSVKDEPLYRTAVTRTTENCVKNAPLYKWDVLEKQLLSWAKARVIQNRVQEVAQKYNEGKHEEARKLYNDGSLELQKLDCIVGLTQDSFISSAERVKLEEKDRLEEHEKILPYGIKYLNDCMRGILPSDVVLIGAGSGVGKTEAAKICAAYIAKERKLDVHYFALEAENNEIERRIKFGLMGKWYKETHTNIPEGMISYANWRYNRLQNELAPYTQRAEEVFKRDYETLHTYYAVKGWFGIEDLEREIYKLRGKTSLVVIDHLHYVDLEGKDENREMTRLVKTIKFMSNSLGIPFMLVCHLKKDDKKRGKDLVPDQADYHGSSNIVKICTQAIMIAPAWDFASADSRAVGKATFMKAVKGRVDGSSVYFTGIGFFDYATSSYTNDYCVGRIDRSGSKWSPATDNYPFWADPATLITDCSDVN